LLITHYSLLITHYSLPITLYPLLFTLYFFHLPMRLLLVDGHYYLYRSFFAIRGLANSQGEPTNAIYGFTKALRKMLIDLKPDLAVVIWDAGLPERRTALQPAYKQHRDEMPDDLQRQQEPLQKLVPLIGLKNVFLPNTEADDLIASYIVAARTEDIECIVATNDKDILQLVREGVSIYSVAKADIESTDKNFALLGIPEVTKKWEVAPAQIADVLALTGDASDNIPGVPGIGKKTAAKLIQRYGSIDALLSATDLEPKMRSKIDASRAQIEQNLIMVALDLDLPLPEPVEALEISPNYPALITALKEFEFKTLTTEIEQEAKRWGIAT
ncbi:MAG: 5'-3' exonuclease H3TH domain-containing protein, partial [Chthoniobacterales bacterium]